MLNGIITLSKADYAISITGIAGPDGATKDKPIGLVYIGVSYKGKNTVEKFIFNGTRQDIRERATTMALDNLRRLILKS
jgi:nicotinamide-nucleotide amidase